MRPDPKLLAVCIGAVMTFSAAAEAGTTRTEYRYPDRPDLVFSSTGEVRRIDEARPMAFSNFEAAISVADARRVLSDTGYESELPRRVPKTYAAEPQHSELLEPIPVEPVASVQNAYVIQAGAFGSYENASRLSEKLSQFGATRISEGYKNGKAIYRVQLGGWSSKQAAAPMLDLIKSRGFDGYVVKAS